MATHTGKTTRPVRLATEGPTANEPAVRTAKTLASVERDER
ncbi:hypothetical protein [Haladaptatus sp. NG-WS-4]